MALQRSERPIRALSSLSAVFSSLPSKQCQVCLIELRQFPTSKGGKSDTPLSFRRSRLWCFGLSIFVKFPKPLSTCALPSCRPDVISAVLASLSARSFPETQACPKRRSTEVFAAEDGAWLCASRDSPLQTPPFAGGSSRLWEWWHV